MKFTVFQFAFFNGAFTSHFFFGFKPCGNTSGCIIPGSGTIPGIGGGGMPIPGGGGGGGPEPGGGGGGGGPPIPGMGGGGGPPIPGMGGGGGPPPMPGGGGGGGGPPMPGIGGGGGALARTLETVFSAFGSNLPVDGAPLVCPSFNASFASASSFSASASSNCFFNCSYFGPSTSGGLSKIFAPL